MVFVVVNLVAVFRTCMYSYVLFYSETFTISNSNRYQRKNQEKKKMFHQERVSWSVLNTQTWKCILEIPFTSPLDWDDFLDLSKMKSSDTIGVLVLRSKKNFARYKHNYLVVYLIIWLLTGIVLDYKYLLSLIIMFCFWISLCFYHVNPNFIATKQHKLSCVSLPKKYNALEIEMVGYLLCQLLQDF